MNSRPDMKQYGKLEIREFGKKLMQHVRDTAIQACDMRLKPDNRSAIAERWRNTAQSGNSEVLLKEVIPDIVDTALSELLYAIDDGRLSLLIRRKTADSWS